MAFVSVFVQTSVMIVAPLPPIGLNGIGVAYAGPKNHEVPVLMNSPCIY
jgi:hypothetical protein